MVHFCNPLLWLEANEPEFAKAINDLCASIRFTNRTTFVLPSKEVCKKFMAHVDEGTPDGDDAAQSILSAHIINAQFDLDKWSTGEIYTSDRSTIPAAKVNNTSGTVTFPNGTKLTLPKDGKTRVGKALVFVADGELPRGERNERSDGAQSSRSDRVRRVRKTDSDEVAGGDEYGAKDRMRTVVFKLLSDEHKKHIGKNSREPLMYMYMVSLLNFLKESHKDVYDAVLPIIDLDPFVTAVLLLQPYKKNGPYILDDDLIAAWGGNRDNYDALRSDWYAHFVGQPYESRIRKMLEAIDNVRCRIMEAPSVREFNKMLVETYNTLHKTGKVDGVEILSEATRKLFSDGHGLMWCDEMRFLLYRALSGINSSRDMSTNLNKFDAILNYVMTMNADKFKATSTLFNVPEGPNKKEMFNAYLVQFVNSNDFLMGCGQGYKEFGDVVPSTDKFMGGGSDDVYNAGADKIGKLEQVDDNEPPTGGYEGGGRATSGPKTAAKAAKARRKKRSSS
jgi:hypothetical protein